MPHVVLNGQLVNATLHPVRDGWLLRCHVRDWPNRYQPGTEVEADSPDRRGLRLTVDNVTKWPAGEPWVWVRLSNAPIPVPAVPAPRRRTRPAPVMP